MAGLPPPIAGTAAKAPPTQPAAKAPTTPPAGPLPRRTGPGRSPGRVSGTPSDQSVLVLVRFDRAELLERSTTEPAPGSPDGPHLDRLADLDDAIDAVHRRLVDAARPRVLRALGLLPDHPGIVHLVDGLAITTTRRWTDPADGVADRVRRAATGRVRSTSAGVHVDVVAAPRLEVADIVDVPPAVPTTMGSTARTRPHLDLRTITLLHEPVVDVATEQLRGTRVHAVTDDPVHGRDGSTSVRAVARTAGLVRALDDAVVRRACADLHLLTSRLGGRPVSVVPVDPATVADRRYVHAVVDLLRSHRLRPTQLILAPDADPLDADADVIDGLRALRRIGVRLATGHLGTAVGALDRSLRPGADVLVLDATRAVRLVGDDPGTAVPDTGTEGDRAAVARRRQNAASASVALARTLGMQVLADGVHDVDTARRARAAGCAISCGTWSGRPVALDHLFD